MTATPRRLLTIVFLWIGIDARASSPCPADPTQLIERHLQEKSPVWADGNTATFFYQGKAEEVILEFDGEILPLKRLPATDVWTLAITRPDLDRAVFSYRLIAREQGHPANSSGDPAVWRGSRAPRAPVEIAELRGQLKTFEVPSKNLLVRRKVTVYLPPGHDPKEKSAVVYAADGEIIDRFAHLVEPLIGAGQIPPVVVVGVHSGGYLGGSPSFKNYDPDKDLRVQEYVPGFNAERFAAHEAFFCDEVLLWAENEFALAPSRDWRAVFGVSNGGRFAVEMGLRHPDLFGQIFGFSVAGDGKFPNLPLGNGVQPRYHLASGLWEESFDHCTASLVEGLKGRGILVEFSRRVAGHDPAIWGDEFASALQRAFSKTK